MNFLDNMAGKAVSGVFGADSNPLGSSLLQMIHNQPGGLSGLVQIFHEKGLGEVVSSWVGTGQNLPVTSEQVHHIFGSQRVQELASQAGVSPEAASSRLAALLPVLVDNLTPNGQLPQHGNLLEMGMNVLKSLDKTGTAA